MKRLWRWLRGLDIYDPDARPTFLGFPLRVDEAVPPGFSAVECSDGRRWVITGVIGE